MSLNYGQGYSVYRSLRDKIRAKKRYGKIYGAPSGQTVVDYDTPVVDYGDSPPVRPQYDGFAGTMSSEVGGVFVKDDSGVQQLTMDQVEAGLTVGAQRATSGEYAIDQAKPYGVGLDIAKKTGSETLGIIGENLLSAMDTSPFGAISGLMAGKKARGPYGRDIAIPGGVLGLVAESNVKRQFEIAEKIKEGTPGFHQMRSGGGLISIVPQTIFGKQVGYGVVGSYDGTSQQAINQYASMYGYDPRSVNLMSRPEDEGFGAKLAGYNMSIAEIGGFTEDGLYTSPVIAEVQNVSDFGLGAVQNHMGLMAEIYGLDTALSLTSNLSGIPDEQKTAISQGLQSGVITSSPVIIDGENFGYETMTGGVVRTEKGDPVRGGGGVVTSGTGLVSKAAVDAARASRGGGGEGQRDAAEAYGRDREDDLDPFASGGKVPQSDRPTPQSAPVVAEAGFIEEEPEKANPAETVADDKAIDVPEGTFIINAPAVEYMGSADVKKMILEAMDEAKKQGIDIQQENTKIPKEDLVSLVVSKGEVIIPPQLAEIIGYDRLNKINNRGKQEVEKRISENGQASEAEMAMRSGGTAEQPEFDIFDMYAKDVLGVIEGEKDEPHVPTSNSGVTIGRGVDLSRFLPEEFARMGVDKKIIEKTRPFQARGMGVYGPRGKKAEKMKGELNLSFEEIEDLNNKVYEHKKANFNKDFPEFKEAGPKDKAMAFSAYYVAGKKGMKERYLTFLDTYKETGDMIKSMDKGFLKILKPGATEYNRAFNAINWYLTADDDDLMRASAGEQAKYTKGMIEAFRRKKELENAPAGSIPPPSRGEI